MNSEYETGRHAHASLAGVRDHNDVAQVIEEMRNDLLAHPNEWENPTLERYLDALAAILQAVPQLHINRGEQPPTAPTWKLVAELLVRATGHE